MYDENGIREHEDFDDRIDGMRKGMKEPVMAPHPCVFFQDQRGRPPY